MKNKKKVLIVLLGVFIGILLLSTGLVVYNNYFKENTGSKQKIIINDNVIDKNIININNLSDATNEYDNSNCYIISENIDRSLIFQEEEIPLIGYGDFNAESLNKVVKIKLYKINNSKEYIDIASSDKISTSNMKLVDSFESKIIKNAEENRASYFTYGKTLKKGYYLAEYNIEGECANFYQLIQISNMSTYVGNTERDLLIWTMDSKTDKPMQNAFVSLNNNKYRSDDNGLIKIENIINKDEDKIFFVKIENDTNELLVAVNDFNVENYYTSFIYTDRPIYKTTDTINIWGYVPTELFIDKIDYENFKIEFNETEYKVRPNDEGIFTLKISYEDIKPDYYRMYLYYNDKEIANTYVEIDDYIKPEIEYAILTDKNNYYLTDTVNAEIKINYLTGEPVLNKKVYVYFANKEYTCTSDSNGKCLIKIKLKDYEGSQNSIDIDNRYILEDFLYLTDKEAIKDYRYCDIENVLSSANIKIINKDIKIIPKLKMVGTDKYYIDLTTQKISIVNDEIIYTNDESSVNVEISEKIDKRSNNKFTRYNPYTKKNEDYYLYAEECDLLCETNVIKRETIEVENGYKEITSLNYLATLEKKQEYAMTKNYTLLFTTTDSNGKTIEAEISMPWLRVDNYYLVTGLSNERYFGFPGFCDSWNGGDCLYYPILGYKNLEYLYSIGDNINTKLYSNDITEKEGGTKLTYTYKEKVLDTLFNENEIIYSDNYFPGAYIGGAYYDPSTNYMYLAKRQYMDYRNTDRYVNIRLSTDKESYKPNDTVELKIKVTDVNGRGVKTNTLISVVDEAIFLIQEDRADEIETIYDNKYFPFYQFSTHLELPFVPGGYGAAKDGGKGKISDTIYFENIKTDLNGEATITFKLNDLETKFRITAISVNNDLFYGSNVKKILSKNG